MTRKGTAEMDHQEMNSKDRSRGKYSRNGPPLGKRTAGINYKEKNSRDGSPGKNSKDRSQGKI